MADGDGLSRRRLSGLPAAKSRVSRVAGVPLARSGRQWKAGRRLGTKGGTSPALHYRGQVE